MKIMMHWKNGAAALALLATAGNAMAAPPKIDQALSCGLDWQKADAALATLTRVDDAPPKLSPLQEMANPHIQRFDEWQALGTREDRFFFKVYDGGSARLFGLKATDVILKRGGGMINLDPEREIRTFVEVDYDAAKKAVLAGFGVAACAEEFVEEGRRGCLLRPPAGAPGDFSLAGVGEVADGQVMFSCLYIDAEAQRRRDGIVDQIAK